MRVLIVRAGALGDTLLTLPAIAALRAQCLDAHIAVAGYPDTWEVASALVDRRLSIDAPALAGLVGGQATSTLIDLVRDHDRTVVWSTASLHPALMESGDRLIQASPYPPPGMHAASWLAQTLNLLDALPSPRVLELTSTERAAGIEVLTSLSLEHPVVIHPGAGAHWKRWPAGRFAQAAQSLLADGHMVVLVEGPADTRVVATIRASIDTPVPVLRNLPLRTLASVLAESKAYLGNDSGISHLASMAGAPTVAIFGPTDPDNWMPLGNVRVLRHCNRHTTVQGQIRVCDDPRCLEAVSVNEVLAAISTNVDAPIEQNRMPRWHC